MTAPAAAAVAACAAAAAARTADVRRPVVRGPAGTDVRIDLLVRRRQVGSAAGRCDNRRDHRRSRARCSAGPRLTR